MLTEFCQKISSQMMNFVFCKSIGPWKISVSFTQLSWPLELWSTFNFFVQVPWYSIIEHPRYKKRAYKYEY